MDRPDLFICPGTTDSNTGSNFRYFYNVADAKTGHKSCAFATNPKCATVCSYAGFDQSVFTTPEGRARMEAFLVSHNVSEEKRKKVLDAGCLTDDFPCDLVIAADNEQDETGCSVDADGGGKPYHHEGGYNALYLDGRVDWVPDSYAEETNGKRKNCMIAAHKPPLEFLKN